MKKFILLLLPCLALSWRASAQITFSTSPEILDAKVQWVDTNGNATGTLTVYMSTDTSVSGVNVTIGSQPDSSDISTTTYTATKGIFGNGNVTVAGNNITVALGTFAYKSDYYIDVTVPLSGGTTKKIAIHSTN